MYDEAKRFAEAMTTAYHREHGLRTRIARIFNTYGPRMRLDDGRAVPNFIVQALRGQDLTVYGDGKQTRSFCYVSDLVDGIMRLMHADTAEPVNIGNPDELSIGQIAGRIIEATGSRSRIIYEPLPVDDPQVRRPDITRARGLLGWEPRGGGGGSRSMTGCARRSTTFAAGSTDAVFRRLSRPRRVRAYRFTSRAAWPM